MRHLLSLFAPVAQAVLLDQKSINPNITNLTATQFTQYGAERKQIKYGPYVVPSTNDNMGMKNFREDTATMPCTDCLLTKMSANLTYPNATYANAHNGMWLHHTVLYDSGRLDTVCSKARGNRFFASGNERAPIDLSLNGTSKTGYHLAANSTLSVLVELMNEWTNERPATLVIDYEYIPGMPSGFTTLDSWWLDITGTCGKSDEDVPEDQDVFNFTAQPYKATSSGTIVAAGGHLHDGGVKLTVSNNNKSFCTFDPSYGLGYGYVDMNSMNMSDMPGMSGSDGTMHMTHISNMSMCTPNAEFSQGDEFQITADYNATAHPLMIGPDDKPEPVMGISIVYVRQGNPSSGGGSSSGGSGSGGGSGTSTSSGAGSTSTSNAAVTHFRQPFEGWGLPTILLLLFGMLM